jgi:hypothetical protein
MFIFHLKFILNSNFFKMSSVRVHFSPGFPLGGGFPAEQNTHVVLCVNRILPEQKNSFLRCSVYFEYRRCKTRLFALREIPLSAELRILLEHLSSKHPPPSSSRTPQEQPLLSSCSLLPPQWSKLLCGKSSS